LDDLWREIEGRNLVHVRASEGESNALFAEIRRHGVAREIPFVIETLRAFAEGRVRIVDKRVVDASGRAIGGYDLTEEIERMVAADLAREAL
jgi:phosphoribosylglycinamide formyltransferase-1